MVASVGMSPPRLAAESSLHWSYIGQVERGQRNVTLHNTLKLAEVLGVDPGAWPVVCARRTSTVRAR
jgi:plasmid maintenance system antidote protein VapI